MPNFHCYLTNVIKNPVVCLLRIQRETQDRISALKHFLSCLYPYEAVQSITQFKVKITIQTSTVSH